jgi:hypothetical protein
MSTIVNVIRPGGSSDYWRRTVVRIPIRNTGVAASNPRARELGSRLYDATVRSRPNRNEARRALLHDLLTMPAEEGILAEVGGGDGYRRVAFRVRSGLGEMVFGTNTLLQIIFLLIQR